MKLADLRRIAIRKNVRIRFSLANGIECVLNEKGIAEILGLRSVPDFNLEEKFADVTQFTLEPVSEGGKPGGKPPKPQSLSREELAALAGGGEAGHEEREE